MGQSSSSQSPPAGPMNRHTSSSSSLREILDATCESCIDYTSAIPDDCLALVFQFLDSGDLNRCSLVSKRWLLVEGQSRHRLTLNAQSAIISVIPSMFSRFDSVTRLSLRCDRTSFSIDDYGLILISLRCRNLTRLKLRGCREITDIGMTAIGKNCKQLKKFSCGSCTFGAKGMNALLDNCSSLEELSVKRLRGVNDGGASEAIGSGAAAISLRSILLKELYNSRLFEPLISCAKKLKTLKLLRCLGDWDELLQTIAVSNHSLVEVHLERLQVSDIGLSALSSCLNLEILHVLKTPDCSNTGVIEVVRNCKFLRKLHIDGWKTNRIGNEALLAIANHSTNLQELVLIGINPSSTSLEAIAMNCKKLERLALCGSETIADSEISCIASKCVALKKLCIKGCPISDEGIEAFVWGCPNLVKIKVKKCRNVTGEVGDWLRSKRGSLVVNMDVCAIKVENVDATTSESGAREDPVTVNLGPLATSSSGRGSVFKTRFGLFGGRGFATSTFRRWSIGNSSSNGNS
ncbi:hypothetical protein R6Q57_012896 [Mikania cordata]